MYEAYYGLKVKPFQLNPDPSFYFDSKQHRRAKAYLEYGLHQNEGFIVVTGEIGAGKTTIVRGLLDTLDKEKVVAAQIVSTQLDADDILRMRYVSINGQFRKMLMVVKMRRSRHSIDMCAYEVTSTGLQVGEPMRGYQALTSGIPGPWASDTASPAPVKARSPARQPKKAKKKTRRGR